MLTRQFGQTSIAMPVLTCGGMRFQHSWDPSEHAPAENQSNLEATVRRALALGINHIETARGYGTSESQLGSILPKIPRHEFILQTKVAPTADPADFERDFMDSLGRLKVPYVDLLGLHGINDEATLALALRDGGCLERALSLKQRGLVRCVGFSTHASEDVILKGIYDGRFEYVNLHYYWAFQQNLRAVRAAGARNMGILVISPNDKGGRLYDPPEKLQRLTAPLSPMVYNDLFCLAHPEISTLSIGVARPSDFDEHAKAVALFEQHDKDVRKLIGPVEARLTAEYERVLGQAWATTWHQGLPEWGDVPGEVNVKEILRLYNLAKAFDLLAYGRMRYNLLENGGHWFPGRGAAKIDDAALIAALSSSPHAAKLPDILRAAHQLLVGQKQKRLQQE
jgi:predicted aldo/keto reductase-like oxidoreductase